MSKLDTYERTIVRYLGKRGKSTINQIAEANRMSWATANNRVKRLYGKGYLKKSKLYWALRFRRK